MLKRDSSKGKINIQVRRMKRAINKSVLPNGDKDKVLKLLDFRMEQGLSTYRFHKELVKSTNSKTTLMTIMKFQKGELNKKGITEKVWSELESFIDSY